MLITICYLVYQYILCGYHCDHAAFNMPQLHSAAPGGVLFAVWEWAR